MTEPCDLSAVEARRLIGTRSLSPTALLQSCARRIEITNRFVNAIVAIDLDTAHKRAAAIEQALMRGEEIGILAGLPIGVKDLQATAGLKTTSGSLLFHVLSSELPIALAEDFQELQSTHASFVLPTSWY